MKLIEVLQKVANSEIKKGTKLWLEECSFNFNGDSFTNEQYPFGNSSFLSTRFLNKEVEFIPPKEKKYFVKFNMRGLKESEMYLNYQTENDYVFIDTTQQSVVYKTHFREDELKSIRPVKEFLDDMKGKYELVEVTNDENHQANNCKRQNVIR